MKKLRVGKYTVGINGIKEGDIIEVELVGSCNIKIFAVNGVAFHNKSLEFACTVAHELRGGWQLIEDSSPVFKFNIGETVTTNTNGRQCCVGDFEQSITSSLLGKVTIEERKFNTGHNWYKLKGYGNWYTEKALESASNQGSPYFEDIKAGDYVIMAKAGGWSFSPRNNGCLALVETTGTRDAGIVESRKCMTITGKVINPVENDTYAKRFTDIPIYVDGKVIIRKATQSEIDTVLKTTDCYKIGDILVSMTHHNNEVWFRDRIFMVRDIKDNGYYIPARFAKKQKVVGNTGTIKDNLRLATSEEVVAYNTGFDTLDEYKASLKVPDYVKLVKDWSVDEEYMGEVFELATLNNLSKFKATPSKENFRECINRWIKGGNFRVVSKAEFLQQEESRKLKVSVNKEWSVGGYVRVIKSHKHNGIIYEVGDWAKIVEDPSGCTSVKVHLFSDSKKECRLMYISTKPECEWIGMEKPPMPCKVVEMTSYNSYPLTEQECVRIPKEITLIDKQEKKELDTSSSKIKSLNVDILIKPELILF